ncbi:hypothetical protein ACIOJE_12450 [Kitasatospora sp. NPDC087861]|uniref:hypothetical protein n=1 Tax=Kitasatospora sp. NPDC087861 TaxID=3364070 RepID=UPI00381701EB
MTMGLPGLDGTRRKTGLTVLHQLLLEVLAPLPGVADVALCGNGLVPPGSPHGPYLYRLEPGTRRALGNGRQLTRPDRNGQYGGARDRRDRRGRLGLYAGFCLPGGPGAGGGGLGGRGGGLLGNDGRVLGHC